MFAAFESRTRCLLCGYQLRRFTFPTLHINKRSIRIVDRPGPMLAWRDWRCPECGSPAGDEQQEEIFAPTAATVAKIRAYRLQRWPELAEEVS